jgi:hypothetical protein
MCMLEYALGGAGEKGALNLAASSMFTALPG